MKGIEGKTYIVTGAASGIGKATAVQLAAEGANLIITDLNEPMLLGVARELQSEKHDVSTVVGDVTSNELLDRLIDTAQTRFGCLDGAVTCAGRILIRPMQQVTHLDWDAIMDLNLKSVFFLVRACAEAMKKCNRHGSIVTLSSTSAHGPRPNNIDYAVSKLGVDQITRTIALEYAPSRIRVNAVSPGVINTPMWQSVDRLRGAHLGLSPGELTEQIVNAIPIRRLGMPEDVASLITFLLSDSADYITGQVIEIDGGYMLSNP